LWRRFGRALRLDADLFEEVEHAPSALSQAAAVVTAAGIGRGIGAFPDEGWLGLFASAVGAPVLWLATTAAVTAIGVRAYHATSSFTELLRTLGFAAAPLTLLAVCAFPIGVFDVVVILLVHVWAMLALVIAARQALDIDTLHALLVVVCSLALGLGALFVLGIVFLGGAAW
jgi:hypothetical protein